MQDVHRRCAEVDVRIKQPWQMAVMNLLSGMIVWQRTILSDKREKRYFVSGSLNRREARCSD